MKHDDMIAVIQAHKDGRDIQVKVYGSFGVRWLTFDNPSSVQFNFEKYEYRIKPEHEKPREWVICFNLAGGFAGISTASFVPINCHQSQVGETIRVREVINN